MRAPDKLFKDGVCILISIATFLLDITILASRCFIFAPSAYNFPLSANCGTKKNSGAWCCSTSLLPPPLSLMRHCPDPTFSIRVLSVSINVADIIYASSTSSLAVFRRKLKTHLFRQQWSQCKGTPFSHLQFMAQSVPPLQIVIMLGKSTRPLSEAQT